MSQDLSQRLLEMIRASPAADEARLVYADWLAEQGDNGRAEFIRAQLARDRLSEWDPQFIRLELRERALLAEHGARWRGELPSIAGVTWGRFRRGLVGRAALGEGAGLKEQLAACQASAPLESIAIPWASASAWSKIGAIPGLRELTLHGHLYRDTDLSGLAQSPVLSTVRVLNLVESRMERSSFRSLLASPHLSQLTTLRMPFHALQTVADLVEATSLPALTELDLSVATTDELGSGGRDTKTIDAAGMRLFAAWPGLAQLRSLDLSGNQISSGGLRTLLSSPRSIGLKELHIREITSREVLSLTAFAKPRKGLSLEVLSLQGGLDTEGAALLADSPCLSELKVLNLHNLVSQDVDAYERLAQAPWFDSLHTIHAGYGEALGLLDALVDRAPARLQTLNLVASLSWAPSLDRIKRFADSPMSNTLLQLDLSFNRFVEPVAAALSEAKGLKNLLSLRLRDRSAVSTKVVEALALSPLGQRLVSFELGSRDAHHRLPQRPAHRIGRGAYTGPLYDL